MIGPLITSPDGAGGYAPRTIMCVANTKESYREKNITKNLKLKIPRLMDCQGLGIPVGEPVAIVGGGPSVKNHLDEIRDFRYIIASGSSHDYLIENGITPSFAVSVDSKIETLDFYKYPSKNTCYLFASQSPPKLFARFKKNKVLMWNFKGQVDEEFFQGEKSIAWGCMVTLNCMPLCIYLGFQHLHIFGMDCALAPDDTSHSYEVTKGETKQINKEATTAYIGPDEIPYRTTTGLLLQAEQFMEYTASPDGYKIKSYIHGDGLLHAWVKESTKLTPEMSRWVEAV